MKLKTIIRSLGVSAMLLVPSWALAASTITFGITLGTGGGGGVQSCSNTICYIGYTIIYIINTILVPLLFAAAFIVFLYGVFKAYIWSHGDSGEVSKGHRLILWGLVGFAVMISIWGLVNIVTNTFGLAGYSAPTPPTSYPSY